MDDYSKRTFDFIEAMQKLKDFTEICGRIQQELEQLGYTHFTVADIPGPGANIHESILFNNRPTDYVEHYARENYIIKDPVMLLLRQATTPFSWGDLRQMKLSRSAQRIIDEGREFGATDGITVPIRTTSGRLSFFGPCGRMPDLSQRARSAAEMICIYSHQAMQNALLRERRGEAPVALTARERETLTWVATGKSDDEIGMILGISRTTVLTHVESAKRKLDATKRIYAVVKALRLGEISL